MNLTRSGVEILDPSGSSPADPGLLPRPTLAYDGAGIRARSESSSPMKILETTLATWCDPEADPAARWRHACDLTELLRRHGDFGNRPPYSFHDRALARLPARLGPTELRLISATGARVLLDPDEPGPMRTSAAFLLGKTRQKAGLSPVLTLLAGPVEMPEDLVRQCAYTFDALAFAHCNDLAALGIDPAAVGDHFERRGVPWDRTLGRVDLSRL